MAFGDSPSLFGSLLLFPPIFFSVWGLGFPSLLGVWVSRPQLTANRQGNRNSTDISLRPGASPQKQLPRHAAAT